MSLEQSIETLQVSINDLNINIAAILNRMGQQPVPAVCPAPLPPKPSKRPAATPRAANTQTTAETSGASAEKATNSADTGITSDPEVVKAEVAKAKAEAAKAEAAKAEAAKAEAAKAEAAKALTANNATQAVTQAMLVEKFKAVAKAKGRDALIAALSTVGAATLTDVKPESYDDLAAELDLALIS